MWITNFRQFWISVSSFVYNILLYQYAVKQISLRFLSTHTTGTRWISAGARFHEAPISVPSSAYPIMEGVLYS
jgi:hypothetical protein